jgi:methyl-accepting chemotaxis protein
MAAAEDMIAEYDTSSAATDDLNTILHSVDPFMEAFDEELVVLIGKLEKLETLGADLSVEHDVIAEAKVSSANTMMIGVSVAAVVGAVVLGVVISRGITNPLTTLISDANIVANGKLGHDFEVQDRADEIGEVITAIKGMVLNTANLVGSVQNAADTVVSMSQELSSTAQQANASMQQVSSATQQIAQGSAQLSTLSQESSGNANRLSAVLQQTGANSEKAGESIQAIIGAMESTTETVENMDSSLDEIGNLANLVTDVANQTQLLALNAAIEAARAGEAGRGFAVVADAVRELSEQTNQAAADTLKSVSDVQKNGKTALEVARSSTTDAAEGVDVVNQTIAGVSQGVGAIEAVVKAIDEMASIAEEAASSAEENTAAAEEQTAAMSQLANNASNLEEIATQLQAEMAKFTL